MRNLFSKRRFMRVIGLVLLLALIVLYIGFPTVMAVAAVMPDKAVVGEAPDGFEAIMLTTDDDVQLGAWYADPTNGAAIILVHGAGSGRESMRSYAAMLHAHGFGVLAISMRGYGDSEGQINRLGWQGTHDIGAAVDFLTARDEVNFIGGLGLSNGGEVLLGAASQYPIIQAIVADGSTFRCPAEYAALPMNRYLYRNFTHNVFSFMVGVFSGDAAPETPMLDSIQAAETTSFLFIAAGNDDDESAFNETFYAAASDRSSLWVVPEVGHTGGFGRYPDEYERRVIDFFQSETARLLKVL